MNIFLQLSIEECSADIRLHQVPVISGNSGKHHPQRSGSNNGCKRFLVVNSIDLSDPQTSAEAVPPDTVPMEQSAGADDEKEPDVVELNAVAEATQLSRARWMGSEVCESRWKMTPYVVDVLELRYVAAPPKVSIVKPELVPGAHVPGVHMQSTASPLTVDTVQLGEAPG